jgi:hypothetical protein
MEIDMGWHAQQRMSVLMTLGCDDDDDYPYGAGCRFDPSYCGGGVGGSCRADLDCFPPGFCCTEKHCGGGTCTLNCNADSQCPPDMACEHNICLFSCRSDYDCAVGQRCEHGRTVCEWP